MIQRKLQNIILLLGVSLLMVVIHQQPRSRRSRLLSTFISAPYLPHQNETMPFDLPQTAADFCMKPTLPPLNFSNCDTSLPLLKILVFGGYTNQLKMIIMGAITALEQNRCFFISDDRNKIQVDGSETLLTRYAEPIGLNASSPIYQKAVATNNIQVLKWKDLWSNGKSRHIRGSKSSIQSLGYNNIEGHRLKVLMLMRLWRPLPEIRAKACANMELHGLKNPYMAFSVRRGDKKLKEDFDFAPSEQYIQEAEKVIPEKFGGNVPKIFVATDDCRVMSEFRQLKPDWTFVSECDKTSHLDQNGFILENATRWTTRQLDEHYEKFFTELFAMAAARYWIGVKYTNVSWFVLFMRRADLDTTQTLNTLGKAKGISPKAWR